MKERKKKNKELYGVNEISEAEILFLNLVLIVVIQLKIYELHRKKKKTLSKLLILI